MPMPKIRNVSKPFNVFFMVIINKITYIVHIMLLHLKKLILYYLTRFLSHIIFFDKKYICINSIAI